MKATSARPPVRVNSHLMVLRHVIPATSPTHLRQQQFGSYTSVRAVNPWKLCFQEILHCSFGACSSRPRTSILALQINLQRSAMDKRCEHFLFRKLSGLPTPATILTCVIQTQPALKCGSRRSAAMRCRSLSYSDLVHSVHQSKQLLWEQIRLSMQACNSQPSSKAKKPETELLGRQFSVKVYRQLPKVQWKLVTFPFALPPFILKPMHYQCLCKSFII